MKTVYELDKRDGKVWVLIDGKKVRQASLEELFFVFLLGLEGGLNNEK